MNLHSISLLKMMSCQASHSLLLHLKTDNISWLHFTTYNTSGTFYPLLKGSMGSYQLCPDRQRVFSNLPVQTPFLTVSWFSVIINSDTLFCCSHKHYHCNREGTQKKWVRKGKPIKDEGKQHGEKKNPKSFFPDKEGRYRLYEGYRGSRNWRIYLHWLKKGILDIRHLLLLEDEQKGQNTEPL